MTVLVLFDKIKIPANVTSINTIIHEIANFDLIDTEDIEDELYYIPEDEPFNINFSTCGYGSRLFIGNIGLPIWVIYLNGIL